MPFAAVAALEDASAFTSILGLDEMLAGEEVEAFSPSGSSLGVAWI